jgi:release factor glutamine methyltransferase
LLADFVDRLPLAHKKFCEPGTGAGLVSLTALRKGALVTAFDINREAVKNCKENFNINKKYFSSNNSFELYESDLFDQIPEQIFDFVVVNPPYFFKDPVDAPARAWYAGAEGEYFTKFFCQVKKYTNKDSQIYMILGDNCDLERIEALAVKEQFVFTLVYKKKVWWEENLIFKIEQNCC